MIRNRLLLQVYLLLQVSLLLHIPIVHINSTVVPIRTMQGINKNITRIPYLEVIIAKIYTKMLACTVHVHACHECRQV